MSFGLCCNGVMWTFCDFGRTRALGSVQVWDNVELFNDGNNLELFGGAVKLIHRNRCKTALRRKAPAVELLHVCDQEVP